MGLDGFRPWIADSIAKIMDFVQQEVLHRKDFAIKKWRGCVLEDPLVHPCRWLRPDNVPSPALFLSCDPLDSIDGSGVLVDPHDIDEHFRKAWLPFFAGKKKIVPILMLSGRSLRVSPHCWIRFSFFL